MYKGCNRKKYQPKLSVILPGDKCPRVPRVKQQRHMPSGKNKQLNGFPESMVVMIEGVVITSKGLVIMTESITKYTTVFIQTIPITAKTTYTG